MKVNFTVRTFEKTHILYEAVASQTTHPDIWHVLRFGDLHEAFLNKLRCSRHGVCVDLDVGQ